jgi:hypothetical protein
VAQKIHHAHHPEEGKEKVEHPLQHHQEAGTETEARRHSLAWGKAVHPYPPAAEKETASHQRG